MYDKRSSVMSLMEAVSTTVSPSEWPLRLLRSCVDDSTKYLGAEHTDTVRRRTMMEEWLDQEHAGVEGTLYASQDVPDRTT